MRDRVAGVAAVTAHALLIPTLVGSFTLGCAGDRIHHCHGFNRVGTNSRLLREHHGVGSVKNCVGDVGHLGPRWARRADHRIEHLRRRDRSARVFAGQPQQPLLHHRHVLDRQLDSKVAAGHHDRVADSDDVLGAGHGLRLLDLCDQRHARVLAQLGHLFRLADEAQRDHVNADLNSRREVGEVFFGDRRQLVGRAGDVQPLARDDDSPKLDFAVELKIVGPPVIDAQSH